MNHFPCARSVVGALFEADLAREALQGQSEKRRRVVMFPAAGQNSARCCLFFDKPRLGNGLVLHDAGDDHASDGRVPVPRFEVFGDEVVRGGVGNHPLQHETVFGTVSLAVEPGVFEATSATSIDVGNFLVADVGALEGEHEVGGLA